MSHIGEDLWVSNGFVNQIFQYKFLSKHEQQVMAKQYHIEKNEPFLAEMKFYSCAGNKAIWFNFENHLQYAMFQTDTNDIVSQVGLSKKTIIGTWAFRFMSKRCGLVLLEFHDYA